MSVKSALRPLYVHWPLSPHAALRRALAGCATVADVGCGTRSPLRLALPRARVIGLDRHAPLGRMLTRAGWPGAFLVGDALRLPLADRSVDGAVASHVIEHVSREDGLRLIAELERVARRASVVVTPNGFLPQRPRDGNPWQEHLSGWTAADLQALGYRVSGSKGWRSLRREYAEPVVRPAFLGEAVAELSQLVTAARPGWCFQLVAVKRLR